MSDAGASYYKKFVAAKPDKPVHPASCATCRFGVSRSEMGVTTFGAGGYEFVKECAVVKLECHKNAPVRGPRGSWPNVEADDWCGQYEAKQEQT